MYELREIKRAGADYEGKAYFRLGSTEYSFFLKVLVLSKNIICRIHLQLWYIFHEI